MWTVQEYAQKYDVLMAKNKALRNAHTVQSDRVEDLNNQLDALEAENKQKFCKYWSILPKVLTTDDDTLQYEVCDLVKGLEAENKRLKEAISVAIEFMDDEPAKDLLTQALKGKVS